MADERPLDIGPYDKWSEQHLAEQILARFQEARIRRYNFEIQWQESSLLCWPEYANTFFYGYDQWPGTKKTYQQIDSSAAMASHRFAAILDSLMTPATLVWSVLRPDNDDLWKERSVKEYFGKVSAILWNERYKSSANFVGQNQQNFQALGVFGNHNMYVDDLDPIANRGMTGLRYRSVSPGEMYYLQNHQGQIDSIFRAFRLTARQIWQRWPLRFPETLRPALDKGSLQPYWILQYVVPTREEPASPFEMIGKDWCCYYLSIEGHCILEKHGYFTFPFACGRYMQAPDEDYGRGPAQMVLPALKTLNAEKGIYLKVGHRTADPIYLLPADDGLNFKAHPGAPNPGFMNRDGKALVSTLQPGSVDAIDKMIDKETAIINDAFLVELFQLAKNDLSKQVQMTAREVIERVSQGAMYVAPTLGRQNSEYCGPIVDRELDILSRLGRLPEMPPVMREANGEYKVVFTSPLARAMRAQEAAGFMRAVELTATVANASQDDSVWDIYDFSTALPEVGEINSVPLRFYATPEQIANKQRARQQAQEREQSAKEMPARAAIIKAQAVMAKAQTGGNIGGTLSGVPPQQMPQVPGA